MKFTPRQWLPAWTEHIRPLALTVMGSLILFFISVGFSLFVSATLLHQQTTSSLLNGYDNAVLQLQTVINRGLDFGRPLNGFAGLGDHLRQTQQLADGIASVTVYDRQGRIIETTAATPPPALGQLASAAPVSGSQWFKAGDFRRVLPLESITNAQAGTLVVTVSADTVSAPLALYIQRLLALVALLGPLVCLAMTGWFACLSRFATTGQQLRKTLRASALVFIGGAQLFFVVATLTTFMDEMETSARNSAQLTAQFLATELEVLDHKSLQPGEQPGLTDHVSSLLRTSPVVGALQLRVNDIPIVSVGTDFSSAPVTADVYHYWPTNSLVKQTAGTVLAYPASAPLMQTFRRVLVDQLTALVLSVLLLVHITDLLSLRLVNNNGPARTEPADQEMSVRSTILVRTGIFLFFCAYDILTSFIPLTAAQLPSDLIALSDSLHKALPISAEATFATLAVLASGVLNRRWGCHRLLLGSVAVAAVGSLIGALANDVLWLIVSRAFSGFAMGMIIMAAKFSVLSTQHRVRDIASIFAALFAGSISGCTIGGLLYELLNARILFALSAVLMVFPGIVLLRLRSAQTNTVQTPLHLKSFVQALMRPAFVLPTLCVCVPAGMTLTGFLYLTLPVVLKTIGTNQADISRLFMLYGFCFIFIGPALARYAQSFRSQAPFVLATGLTAGAAITLAGLFPSLEGFALAALLMGISQCLLASSALDYVLSLESMKSLDPAIVSSIYSMCERCGQIAGPLVFGAVLTLGTHALTAVGVVIGLAAIVFIALSGFLRRRSV